MVRRFYKYKLLLDEGFYRRNRLPRLNERYDVKHITGDLRYEGMPDSQIYELARKDNRLVVTFNEKDFRELATKSTATGVIGVSGHLTVEQIDTKLMALLARSKPKDLFGKFTPLSGEAKAA